MEKLYGKRIEGGRGAGVGGRMGRWQMGDVWMDGQVSTWVDRHTDGCWMGDV